MVSFENTFKQKNSYLLDSKKQSTVYFDENSFEALKNQRNNQEYY